MLNAVFASDVRSFHRWQTLNFPIGTVGAKIHFSTLSGLREGHFWVETQNGVWQIQAPAISWDESGRKPHTGSQVTFQVTGLNVDQQTLCILHPVELQVLTAPEIPITVLPPPERNRLHLKWQQFLRDVDQIYQQMGMDRVSTPSLVQCPGVEPVLEPMAVRWRSSRDQWHGHFLPTSPELSLKKLLAQGWTDLYEIRPCFRAEENSPTHRPEFTMIEWYRGFATSAMLLSDLQSLFDGLVERGWITGRLALRERTMSNAFKEYVGLDLTPNTTLRELQETLRSHGMYFDQHWSWDDCFHVLFLEKVEPEIGQFGPEVVSGYPPSQSALAQIRSDGYADRMELYWRGMELANGFGELTDAKTQRLRFDQELKLRQIKQMTEVPLDADFLQALSQGIPPSAGMALGLDRLFMACESLKDLGDFRLFETK